MPPINRPLQGLRVIDLCHGRGDLCGRLLGDLGADVLLVEPPTGSTSRHLPPFGTDGTSLYFAYRNTNKRSAVLDLSNQVDRDRLLSLTARADVVVESSPPGHLASLGIGAEDLAATNSELVVASLTDFGQTGPYRDMESTDDVILGLSGWLALSGIPEKPPLCPRAPWPVTPWGSWVYTPSWWLSCNAAGAEVASTLTCLPWRPWPR